MCYNVTSFHEELLAKSTPILCICTWNLSGAGGEIVSQQRAVSCSPVDATGCYMTFYICQLVAADLQPLATSSNFILEASLSDASSVVIMVKPCNFKFVSSWVF